MNREVVVAEHGPWFAFNLNLPDGWTVGPDLVGMAEQRVAAVAQVVTDFLPSIEGATVLDIGAHEGGFGLELAAMGARVTFVEGRAEHLAHAQYAAEALGVSDRCRFVQADIRDFDGGEYDVVLCLGLLYHLRGQDLGPFLARLRAMCRRLLVVDTQVAMRSDMTVTYGGDEYHGMVYRENASHPGASIEGDASVWLTKPSLVNLLRAVGFTTVSELWAPRAEASYKIDDHVVLLALAGTGHIPQVVPAGAGAVSQVPESPARFTHRAQGWRYRLRGRLAGSGPEFWATLWEKHAVPAPTSRARRDPGRR